MADRRYHVASLLIGVVLWTGENDTKTISVDANRFENGVKQPRFRLKTNWFGRGLKHLRRGRQGRRLAKNGYTYIHIYCAP